MIFFIFIILLVSFADSIWCFVIPLLCIFLRAAYREANVNLIRIATIIFALILFVLNLFFSDKSVDENILGSIRIVLFSALLIHGVDNINKRPLKSTKGYNLYFYMGMRIMSIIRERLSDTWLIFNIRWKQTKLIKKPKLLFSTFGNFLLESVRVNNQINLVNYEKGGIAVNQQSIKRDHKRAIVIPFPTSDRKVYISYSFVGDLVLVVLIILPQIILETNSLPRKIIEFIQF